MKTESQITKMIELIERDPRYISGLENPATIDTNAPLALIQLEMEVKIKVLKWILQTP